MNLAECLTLSVRNGAYSTLNVDYHYAGISSCPEEQPYFISVDNTDSIYKNLDKWTLSLFKSPKTCASGGYHFWTGVSPWKPGPLDFSLTCTG